MPHAYIARTLPSMTDAFAAFPGFPAGCCRQSSVQTELRRAGRRLQRTQPQPFYSMREVAAFFSLPLRSVALIYAALEQEGLLIRIRATQTKLAGKKPAAPKPVSGVVGLPLWTPAFVTSPYIRSLHVHFNEQLRRHGFVADSIFFHSDEEADPRFVTHLKRHALDAILWINTNFRARHLYLSLRDLGMRQVFLLPAECMQDAPGAVYRQDWLPAYRQMAAAWAAAGIKRVLIPQPVDELSVASVTRNYAAALKTAGISIHVVPGRARDFIKTAQTECARGRTAIAFLEWPSADAICNGYPQAMEELARITRVGFCRGRIRIPRFSQEGVRADVIIFDPAEISQRMAQDLTLRFPLSEKTRHTFNATYRPDFDFSENLDRSFTLPGEPH